MNEKLNLIETIAKQDMFSVFSRLMGTSGANAVLSEGGEYTVFVPTNDAFGKIPDKRMNALLQEPGQTTLKTLLSCHIVPDKMLAASLGSAGMALTVGGTELVFTDNLGGLKVNGSGVQARNIEASNGIIHALDTVLDHDVDRFRTGPLSSPNLRPVTAEPRELETPTLDARKADSKLAAAK